MPDGGRKTVYGYPQPQGDSPVALATTLAASEHRLQLTFARIGAAAHLCAALDQRLERVGERSLAVCDLSCDPLDSAPRGGRKAVRTALARGCTATVTGVQTWFGAFYRQGMSHLRAERLYSFDDEYFAAIAHLPGAQVTVRDAEGVAAAGVILFGGLAAWQHLAVRRSEPPPEYGVMDLAMVTRLRLARERNLPVAVLGGGLSDDADDPLLLFKRKYGRLTITRPTYVSAAP